MKIAKLCEICYGVGFADAHDGRAQGYGVGFGDAPAEHVAAYNEGFLDGSPGEQEGTG